ncbi:MAG TPA: hypothetical protein PLR25_21095, partial [Planctomycetaceae bacterium]|nr:hypothetical protein [Planctomycetaceae bacterium]
MTIKSRSLNLNGVCYKDSYQNAKANDHSAIENDGIDNVRIHHDDRALIIDSQGYPNHPTAIFPNSGNPNKILVQQFQFRLPLEPKLAGQITCSEAPASEHTAPEAPASR